MGWHQWREYNYGLLASRCRGRCEGCSTPAPLEPHHIRGRENEPWSSHVAILAGLCGDCHDRVTGRVGAGIDQELRGRLEQAAFERFCIAFQTRAPELTPNIDLLIEERLKSEWEFDGRKFTRRAA